MENAEPVTEVKFVANDSFVPYLIQAIIYDKLLDRYSILEYQLSSVDDSVIQLITDSQSFSTQIGIETFLETVFSAPVNNPLKKHALCFGRFSMPLGEMNFSSVFGQ